MLEKQVLRLGPRELGATLRAWRDRLTPGEAGLDGVEPRRTPGLRRDELARLAGVSRDYLTQLEQGRAGAPSAQVLGALARALRLTPAEQTHLFRLAGLSAPVSDQAPKRLPADVDRLVAGMIGNPVAVYDVRWNLLAWNPLWTHVMGDPAPRPARERNLVRRQFLKLPSRVVRDQQETADFETALVADLRDSATRFPGDPGLASLVAELNTDSPAFRARWDSRPAGLYDAEAKTIDHPSEGGLAISCTVLTTRTQDLRIAVYAPDGPHTSRAFQRLHDGADEMVLAA